MKISAFDRAFAFVMRAEGGATITNDPDDPGGLTKWGISKRSHPDVDIEALTEDQAREIYRQGYWLKAGCAQLPEPIAFAVFDCAVNQGPAWAIRLLQRAVRVEDDGVLGARTLGAISARSVDYVLVRYCEERWDRYRFHPKFGKFGRGWTFRLFRGLSEALMLAAMEEAA